MGHLVKVGMKCLNVIREWLNRKKNMALFKQEQQITLYYVYDPMCSWCWGYAPTWQLLRQNIPQYINVRYCVGGLAPDSDDVMEDDMQVFLQNTWHKIARQLGTQFNFDFWQECTPRRSTYNACRAVIIAREYNQEKQMLLAIQQAYYLHAKNPSDIAVLKQLFDDIGIDCTELDSRFKSPQLEQKLLKEISQARQLPIQGFPSLVLEVGAEKIAIPIDYLHWHVTLENIMNSLHSLSR